MHNAGAVPARRGISVLLLEKDPAPVDRVRGESTPPRGVEDARKLGVVDLSKIAAEFP